MCTTLKSLGIFLCDLIDFTYTDMKDSRVIHIQGAEMKVYFQANGYQLLENLFNPYAERKSLNSITLTINLNVLKLLSYVNKKFYL